MSTSGFFQIGTEFRQGGDQFVVFEQGNRNRAIRNIATREVTTRSVALLRADYMSGKIVLNDLLTTSDRATTAGDNVLERSLADFGERAIMEVRVKRYYLDGICPDGRMRYQRAELAKRLHEMYCELPQKLPGVPLPAKAPCASTLYGWRQQWLASGFAHRRLVNRFDLRGRRPSPIPQDILPILEHVVDEYYASANRPNVATVLRLAQAEVNRLNLLRAPTDQLPQVTRSQLQRVIAGGDRFQQLRARYGLATANRATKIYGRKEDVEGLLQRVEMDHTPLDILCTADENGMVVGRPHLTVLIDVASRMILSAWISFRTPNASTVLRALKQAILPKDELLAKYKLSGVWPARGVMRELVLDNGKEFHSNALEAAAQDLGIQLIFCPPRQPRFKGVVERMLKEINYSFIHLLPGSTFAKYYLREEYDSLKNAVVPIGDLQRMLYRWIVDVYHKTFHRGLMNCPLEVWMKRDGVSDFPVLPRRREVLDVYLTSSESHMLSSKGIEDDKLFYTSPELCDLRLRLGNQSLTVRRNPDDCGHIHVLHPESKTYFKATCTWPDYANGITHEQHTYLRRRARETYNALPHRHALLAAKQELMEEARAMRMSHEAAKAPKKKKKGRGGDAAAADSTKPKPPRKPLTGMSGVEIQCRSEVAAAVQVEQPSVEEPSNVTFDDVEIFSVNQSQLF